MIPLLPPTAIQIYPVIIGDGLPPGRDPSLRDRVCPVTQDNDLNCVDIMGRLRLTTRRPDILATTDYLVETDGYLRGTAPFFQRTILEGHHPEENPRMLTDRGILDFISLSLSRVPVAEVRALPLDTVLVESRFWTLVARTEEAIRPAFLNLRLWVR